MIVSSAHVACMWAVGWYYDAVLFLLLLSFLSPSTDGEGNGASLRDSSSSLSMPFCFKVTFIRKTISFFLVAFSVYAVVIDSYHDTGSVVFKQFFAFRPGVALKKLFRVPFIEASIVLLLQFCAIRSNARRHCRSVQGC